MPPINLPERSDTCGIVGYIRYRDEGLFKVRCSLMPEHVGDTHRYHHTTGITVLLNQAGTELAPPDYRWGDGLTGTHVITHYLNHGDTWCGCAAQARGYHMATAEIAANGGHLPPAPPVTPNGHAPHNGHTPHPGVSTPPGTNPKEGFPDVAPWRRGVRLDPMDGVAYLTERLSPARPHGMGQSLATGWGAEMVGDIWQASCPPGWFVEWVDDADEAHSQERQRSIRLAMGRGASGYIVVQRDTNVILEVCHAEGQS